MADRRTEPDEGSMFSSSPPRTRLRPEGGEGDRGRAVEQRPAGREATDRHPVRDDGEFRARSDHRSDARPGSDVTEPTDLPKAGWKQILVRTKDEIKDDNVGLMAAGVAFYAMLAIFPTMIAALTLWGLVSDPDEIRQTVEGFAGGLPSGAENILTSQMQGIAESTSGALTWALVASVLGALWSASSGTKGLINAVNSAYDEEDTRGFFRTRGLALALTVGGILFALIAISLIAIVPAVLGAVGLGDFGETLVNWGRWPLLAIVIVVGLAVIYRFAPDRDDPKWNWASVGSIVATVLWLLASAGFAWYVESFGNYEETYGALAGVIVLMLWFFLTAFAILLGAELNAEMEHQTRRDTTRGEPDPMGERGAIVADTTPEHKERGGPADEG